LFVCLSLCIAGDAMAALTRAKGLVKVLPCTVRLRGWRIGPCLHGTLLRDPCQALKRGDERFSVRASSASREVVATLEVEDGAVLELLVKLPACLPLRAPEVVCRRKVRRVQSHVRHPIRMAAHSGVTAAWGGGR
jgi:hypothetical protein